MNSSDSPSQVGRHRTPEDFLEELDTQYEKAQDVLVAHMSLSQIQDLIGRVRSAVADGISFRDGRHVTRSFDEVWNGYGAGYYRLLYPIYQARLRTLAAVAAVFNLLDAPSYGYRLSQSRQWVVDLREHLVSHGRLPQDEEILDIRSSKSYLWYTKIEDISRLKTLLMERRDDILRELLAPGGTVVGRWKAFAESWNKKNALKYGGWLYKNYNSLCDLLWLPDRRLETFFLFLWYTPDEISASRPSRVGMKMLDKKLPYATKRHVHNPEFLTFLTQEFPREYRQQKNLRDAFRVCCTRWNIEIWRDGDTRARQYGYNVPTSLNPTKENVMSWRSYFTQQDENLVIWTLFQSLWLVWDNEKKKLKKISVQARYNLRTQPLLRNLERGTHIDGGTMVDHGVSEMVEYRQKKDHLLDILYHAVQRWYVMHEVGQWNRSALIFEMALPRGDFDGFFVFRMTQGGQVSLGMNNLARFSPSPLRMRIFRYLRRYILPAVAKEQNFTILR